MPTAETKNITADRINTFLRPNLSLNTPANAQPKAQYFAKILASGGYESSFFLLGWTLGSLDSHNIFANLYACRDDAGKGGQFNIGGYCNPEVDALAKEMGSTLHAPFMTLSFMSLLVVPEIKLSDRGLFDSKQLRFIELFAPPVHFT